MMFNEQGERILLKYVLKMDVIICSLMRVGQHRVQGIVAYSTESVFPVPEALHYFVRQEPLYSVDTE